MIFLLRAAILSFSLILLISLASYGQQIDRNQRHPKEAYFDLEIGKNDYIKEWLVIGPFPREFNTDFLKSHGGEANIRPYEGMRITTPDGKTLTWKRYKSQSDVVNLIEAIGESEEVVAYAACNIISPEDQSLEMLLGSDDGVKVWLNGKLIHSNPIEDGLTLDEDRLPVNLKKGVNRCLVKVDQNYGDWGFALRLIDYQGYLQSIKLELSVRRQKKNGNEPDVLSFTTSLTPKSTIWKLPSIQNPVSIEIRDDAGSKHSGSQNASPLQILQTRIGQTVNWTVPQSVQGTLSIIARHTDNLGKTQEASFTCKAHNIVAVTPRVGYWETYSVAKGMGGSGVVSIVQDRNGLLWFGSPEGGICRYDGRAFKTFTKEDGLPSNNVWVVFEDSKGNLWFGTMDYWTAKGSGVCKYDGNTFKTFTTKDGLVNDAVIAIYEDDRGHLWFGTMKGVSEFDGKTFRNYTAENGLLGDRVGAIIQDKDGNLWFGHGLKLYGGGSSATRYDKKSFKHFTTKDGLVNNAVTSITTDKQGNLWFGTWGGVSKYDGKSFQNFTTAEGLVHNWVNDMFRTRDGDLWIATWGGVSRYKDGKFENFTTNEGLSHDWVASITEDREGNLWFGTWNSGVSRYNENVENIPVAVTNIPILDKKGNLWFATSSGLIRYDGRNLHTFAIEDGLPYNRVLGFCEDRGGNIWIGTNNGLAKYDGEKFRTFTTKDGLTSNDVGRIYEDSKGILWMGTMGGGICTYDGKKFVKVAGKKELGEGWGWIGNITGDSKGNIWFSMIGYGVGKYDGMKFTKFSAKDGLTGKTSWEIIEDHKGNIWIATVDGGAIRYDGKTFKAYTTKDGLAENQVERVFEDRKGNLWFSVGSGGVHKFDGKNFQIFTIEDGLLNNFAWGIMEDEKGNIIFATSKGITIYTPPKDKIPPPVYVTEVVADKVYPIPVETLHATSLRIPSTTPRISFAYYGTSFKTKRMKYNYMLEGYDKDWKATWDETISYEKLKPGKYSFKVIAINRDLVYSEKPTIVQLTIVTPFYLSTAFLIPTVGLGTILLLVSIVSTTTLVKHRRQVLAYQRAAVEELQDARQMQMSLLPESAPPLESIEIAGKCISANTVGGDFFDYLHLPRMNKNQIAIAIGDVTGKGLKGAMNAVMVDGILHMAMEGIEQLSPASLLMKINNILKDRMERDMNVTMVIGLINAETKTLTIANAGHHIHPLILRNGELQFLKAKGLPLGVKAGVKYGEEQFALEEGSIVIFMTDGIIEARDKEDKLYLESGRLEKTISQFDRNMPAEAMVEAIIADAMAFGGEKDSRDDDMTVVVVKTG